MAVCMPFGLSQLRNRHLVSAVECCFVCACVFFWKDNGYEYICVSSAHFQISRLSSPCVRFWINSFRPWRSHQDYLQQTINEQLISERPSAAEITLLNSFSGWVWRTHAHTRAATHKQTDTYTLRRGWSWRCVLCNSGVKWLQTPTRPQQLPRLPAQSCWERNRRKWRGDKECKCEPWGGDVIGQVTLINGSDPSICHRWSLHFPTFAISSSKGRIFTSFLNEISYVATLCNNVTMLTP